MSTVRPAELQVFTFSSCSFYRLSNRSMKLDPVNLSKAT